MPSDDVVRKIRANLYAVNSYYAYQDYRAANPKGRTYDKRGNPKPLNPYTLSPLTQEARKYYHMAMQEIWDRDTENDIKAYLLRLRKTNDLYTILDWERSQHRANPHRTE